MKVKFKKLVPEAFEPTKAYLQDSGYDLTCISYFKNYDYGYVELGTGLAVSIPRGYTGLIFSRSSISQTSHTLANSCGILDEGFFGEIKLRMRYVEGKEDMEYVYGDRIGQLVIIPKLEIEWEEVRDLGTSVRGEQGFGSSNEN